ncbi:hypothetical protein [Psychroflexus sp. MBR-150]|jgi:agmatine deiminase
MVTSKELNKVCFSERLLSDERFTQTCNALTELLKKHLIKYDFLKATKDIWCRDYMPIQIEKEKFVQLRYEPSYLKDDLELQSDPIGVCDENGNFGIFWKLKSKIEK